jgi:cytoskeletal protein CcmA (bactofilin family)
VKPLKESTVTADRKDCKSNPPLNGKQENHERWLEMKKKAALNDIFGNNTDFEGTLTCPGDIMIDGRFRGEIKVEGTLFVGENASIEANIRAAFVVSGGEIRGNIEAEKRIEISAPGKIYGNMSAPSLVIEEGVLFEGNCQMEGSQGTEKGHYRELEEGPQIGKLSLTGPDYAGEKHPSATPLHFEAV